MASPGRTVWPSPGSFDFTIVRTGWPLKVDTSGELTVCPLAAMRARSVTGFGAPMGTVAVNVSRGDTRTLFDVAGANVTGPLPAAVLSLNVRLPGVAPAETVQVHSYVTGSPVPAISSSAVVRTGPVRVAHEAPFVEAVASVPAVTLLIALLAVRLSATLTVSPVTVSDRDAVNELDRPVGLRP